LIIKEGYSTNQNLEINQLEPSHKKSLRNSYINHDILNTLEFLFLSSLLSHLSFSSVLPTASSSRYFCPSDIRVYTPCTKVHKRLLVNVQLTTSSSTYITHHNQGIHKQTESSRTNYSRPQLSTATSIVSHHIYVYK